jgi:heat-inducible transcriptional repressor
MTNAAKNYIVKLDMDLARNDLELISNYINEKYEAEAVSLIYGELSSILSGNDYRNKIPGLGLAKAALDVLDTVIKENIDNEIYLAGLNYFMDEPEFRDPEISRRVFGIFSDRRDLLTLFRREMTNGGMRVYIGKENSNKMLRDCTMITAGYSLRGRTVGRFGVIGPTRMDYEKALSIMAFMSELMSCKIEEING